MKSATLYLLLGMVGMLGCAKPKPDIAGQAELRKVCQERHLRCYVERNSINRFAWYGSASQDNAPHGHWYVFAETAPIVMMELREAIDHDPANKDSEETIEVNP